ncbi:hypothetical protein ACHWQZ_G008537 [Mnemiopsis leidyi]
MLTTRIITRSLKYLTHTYKLHSLPTCHDHRKMKVNLIPLLKDNYGYLIIDESTNVGAVVDPVTPDTVLKAISDSGVKVDQVLTTHHHWDHAGGNEELNAKKPGMTFYGGDDRIGAMNKKVVHNETFSIGSMKVTCFETPCHTTGHICYLVEGEGADPAVFTGDTLFAAGCGRFFEGTAPEMYRALIEILSSLPDNTRVYCGHEYTAQNLKFAKHVEPENTAVLNMIDEVAKKREAGEPTIPTTIGQEKTFNPFMRVRESAVQKFAGCTDPVEVMREIRAAKDNFRG